MMQHTLFWTGWDPSLFKTVLLKLIHPVQGSEGKDDTYLSGTFPYMLYEGIYPELLQKQKKKRKKETSQKD